MEGTDKIQELGQRVSSFAMRTEDSNARLIADSVAGLLSAAEQGKPLDQDVLDSVIMAVKNGPVSVYAGVSEFLEGYII